MYGSNIVIVVGFVYSVVNFLRYEPEFASEILHTCVFYFKLVTKQEYDRHAQQLQKFN